jgi:ParB family chromosome partitioning protein
LADSIREHGVIQPLIVAKSGERGYTLIAGERRWRASQMAGLKRVPVIVKEFAPQQMLEVALIENIQRSDLSPMEEAEAFQHLVNEFGLTQEQVAQRVGKNRVSVTNTLRLLRLPEQAKLLVAEGKLSEGHARALLSVPSLADQLVVIDEIIKKELNVRQTEELVRRMATVKKPSKPTATVDTRGSDLKQYESKLRSALGTKVQLQRSGKGGKIVIEYYSDEEFGAIYERIVGA